MAGTEAEVIVPLGPDDARAGLLLSTEAHWNQNDADWRFFLTAGRVFGVRDGDGRLVASAALLPYTSGNAWISMVLVTASWRRRGLATRLVDACLAAAAKQNLTTSLDATPDGAAVYGPLGFKPTLELRRLRLAQPMPATAEATPSLSSGPIEPFIAQDHRTIGFDRTALLKEISGRPDSRLLSNGAAFALVRGGRTARHIGPLFAESADQALTLVNAIVRSETGPLLIDAVHAQEAFLNGLTGSGWNIERPFQRMRFGDAGAQPTRLPFAVAGPEFG
jgi:GNAT superfamily N-acetyltransferase